MPPPTRFSIVRCLLAVLVLPSTSLAAHATSTTPKNRRRSQPPAAVPVPASPHLKPLSSREQVVQLLDRFTYGPRPGEIDQVLASGATAWLDRQLAPETIPDPALAQRLAEYPTLTLSPAQAVTLLPDNGVLRQIADGKRAMPADPELAAVYEVELLKYRRREERRKAQAVPSTATPASPVSAAPATPLPATLPSRVSSLPGFDDDPAADRKDWQAEAAHLTTSLLALPKEQRMPALLALPIGQRAICATFVVGDQRAALLHDLSPHEKELFYAMSSPPGSSARLLSELSEAKVLRDILSERQLQQVMTDFWFNHFNVFAGKESDRWYTTSYERDAIRPHALGHFRDLLLATAQSPAMLVYLDNWQSIGPDSPAGLGKPRNPRAKKTARGLNENYGRELMELHTLSVTGGYTQADVTALASIFTGWGVDHPQQGGAFTFDQRRHEPGDKHWLGQTIHQGRAPDGSPDGMREGLQALDVLSRSPATAHFISYLLAQRFVADTPPPALVDRLAFTYLATDGDIKAMIRTIVASPEFTSRAYFHNQVKTPVEFLASSFRATGTGPTNPGALVKTLRQMGMPPFGALPPTGYALTADHWMNSAAIVDRLAFADALTSGRYPDQRFDSPRLLALALLSGSDGFASSTCTPPCASASATQPAAAPVPASSSAHTRMLTISAGVPPPLLALNGPQVAIEAFESTLLGTEARPATSDLIRQQMEQLVTPVTPVTDSLNTLARLVLSSPDFQLR